MCGILVFTESSRPRSARFGHNLLKRAFGIGPGPVRMGAAGCHYISIGVADEKPGHHTTYDAPFRTAKLGPGATSKRRLEGDEAFFINRDSGSGSTSPPSRQTSSTRPNSCRQGRVRDRQGIAEQDPVQAIRPEGQQAIHGNCRWIKSAFLEPHSVGLSRVLMFRLRSNYPPRGVGT